ncbi:MAG: hypothetical protein QQN65_06445 [Nitrosopumilus sp.]
MKSVLIVLLLLFMSGCSFGFRSPVFSSNKVLAKEKMLAGVKEEAKSAAWALSESNKLFATFMIFAVIGGIIGGVTRLKFGWVICACSGLGALSIPLIAIFASAMMKYLWVIGLVGVAALVIGLGFLVVKLYAVSKESFAYAEGLKRYVSEPDLNKNNKLAKATQPKFVRNMIKLFREG